MNLKAFRSAATLSFSVALAGVMFAQGSPSGQQATPQRQGMQGMDGQTVTVTGCLVRASDVRGGAAATAPTTSGGTTAGTAGTGANDYVLANVQMRSTSPGGSGTTAGGTTGGGTTGGTTAGGAEASPSRGTNLRLSGSEDTKFTQHVNQQVEITGRLSMNNDRGGAGATGTTTSGTGTTGTGTTGTTGTGTTGTTGKPTTGTGTAASSGAGMSGQDRMGQLQVQTIRPTGQSCTAGGGQ